MSQYGSFKWMVPYLSNATLQLAVVHLEVDRHRIFVFLQRILDQRAWCVRTSLPSSQEEEKVKKWGNVETRKNSLQLDVSVGHGHVCVWIIDVPERQKQSCWGTTGGKTNWFNCIEHQFLLKWILEQTNLDIVGTAKSNVWKTAHLIILYQL